MLSDPDAASAPAPASFTHTPAAGPAAAAVQLAQASRALWIATLSLMTAFMQNPAPAHRCLLARRIARNLETLAVQDCFDTGCRARFERLAGRWQQRAEQLASGTPATAPRSRLLRFLS